MADRKLIVTILGDSKSLERAFLRSGKAAQGFTAQVTNTSKAVRNAFAAAGLTVGVAAATNEIRKAVSAASDLEEQVNKSNVVFGRSAAAIQAWSQTTAAAFGLSQRAALEAAGGFGQILDTAGLTEDQAAQFSRRLVELAADIASFNNIDPTEALDKLRSGLVGEAEPLRRVGVLLSEARVKQAAYAEGIAASGKELTEGQKVQARYMLILRDTATAQGDFGRTSESLANQQRILAAQVENLRAKLGEAFLPAITGVVQGINRWLASSENQERVQRTLTSAMQTTARAADAFQKVIRAIAPVVSGLVRGLGGLEQTVKLLAAAFIATKIARFTGLLDALGASAVGSSKNVNVLRASLLRLGALGVITLGVEVVLNRQKIQKTVNDFLRGDDPLGIRTALAGKEFDLPIDLKAADLQAFRDGIVSLGGVSGALIKELDKIIARMRTIENKALKNLRVPGEENRPGLDLTPTAKGAAQGSREVSAGVRAALDAISQAVGAAGKSVDAAVKKAAELARVNKIVEALQAAADRAALAVSAAGLALDRAGSTKTLRDDIDAYRLISEALQAQEKAIRAQIALKKEDLGLQNELVSVQSQQISNEQALAAAVKQRAEAQKAAARASTQAAQFRALGRDSTGAELTPTVKALRSQFAKLREIIPGSILDTKKVSSLLGNIAKLFAGKFGKITKETRELLASIFDDLNDQLKQTGGPLTKGSSFNVSQFLAGLGLDPDKEKEARARLSRFNTSGLAAIPVGGNLSTAGAGQPIIVHTTVELDGKQVGQSTKRFLQNDRRHNPPSRR